MWIESAVFLKAVSQTGNIAIPENLLRLKCQTLPDLLSGWAQEAVLLNLSGTSVLNLPNVASF